MAPTRRATTRQRLVLHVNEGFEPNPFTCVYHGITSMSPETEITDLGLLFGAKR